MDEKITAVAQHRANMANLHLPEEIIKYVESIAEGNVCEWIYLCALDGMTLQMLQKLGKKRAADPFKKVAAIREARREYLSDLYRDNAEVSREVEGLYRQVKDMCKESKELRTAMEGSYAQARKIQADAYEMALKSKEETIREREREVAELKRQIEELTEKEVQKEHLKENPGFADQKETVPNFGTEELREKEGMLWRFWKNRESKRFIDLYLKGDAYSPEQKEYLLNCYESGMPLRQIEQIASPELSVEIMRRLNSLSKKQ